MSSSFKNKATSTSDGTTGITPVGADNVVVTNIADRFGRFWMRIFNGSAEVSSGNPLPVTVTASANPIGGATAANQATANASLASIDTKVTGPLATTTNQALQLAQETAINTVLGTTADATDQTGTTSTANAKLRGLIQLITTSSLGAMVRGTIANDAADSGNPVKTGHRARSITTLPTAVADDDRVDSIGSQQGETYAYLSRANAGEDLTNNWVRMVPALSNNVSTDKYTQSIASSLTTSSSAVKASAGNLYKVYAKNSSSSMAYLYIVNLTAYATGTAPVIPAIPVVPGGIFIDEWPQVGLSFSTGISIGWGATDSATSVTAVATGPITALYT